MVHINRNQWSSSAGLCTWSYENRYSRDNPLISYKKAKIRPKPLARREGRLLASEVIILSPEEQQGLLALTTHENFTAVRNQAIVALILASGLFAEEVIDLELKDVDLSDGYAEVCGEERRQRCVRLDVSICKEACLRWLYIREQVGGGDCLNFFLSRQGGALSKRALYNSVSEQMITAGIEKNRIGPEVLRQTSIITMFQRSMGFEEIQKNTGIKTLAQLEKYRRVALTVG